ncbi:hypothetical protein B8W69_20910 [Mycobacterium vulneris]|uniref:Uncharacterized protein n=1 Tax=Mycolicibacterium vulneris TaxID=547163 RepID=A0A1X2KS66_9MYCO|nr:hypothetical protein [Mycolicibacterium vulneris]OSC24608.1 hypothetical protein B8W69_20910 [Mycolicibacterium vulneris]
MSANSSNRSISGGDIEQWLKEGKKSHAIDQPTLDKRPRTLEQQMAGWLADHVEDIAAIPNAGEIYRGVKQLRDDILRVLNGE